MSLSYYNEIDKKAAACLRELINAGEIAPGIVDERSIEDVRPADLRGFTQCHFFAGIGVWSHALRRAGWPDDRPVWTGSCPCQPFSQAGRGDGFADERHLWPAWLHLIAQCRPPGIFGEQVASADGLTWLDLVQPDLEDAGYACGVADLCAAGVGAPHIRQRLWFVGVLADAESSRRWPGLRDPRSTELGRHVAADDGRSGGLGDASGAGGGRDGRAVPGAQGSAGRGVRGVADLVVPPGATVGLADAPGGRRGEFGHAVGAGGGGHADGASRTVGLGDAERPGREGGLEGDVPRTGRRSEGRFLVEPGGVPLRFSGDDGRGTPWSRADWVFCRDGKYRPVEPFSLTLVDGLARGLGHLRPEVAAGFEEEVVGYARAANQDPRQTLLDLWCALYAQALCVGPTRRPDGVPAAPVLLAFLRQLAIQGRPLAQSLPRTGSEAHEAVLRSVWGNQVPAGSPHQRGLDGQLAVESSNLVRVLSSVLARRASQAWGEAALSDAFSTFPLAHGAGNRMARLRGYGNAINAEVAATFIKAAIESLGT